MAMIQFASTVSDGLGTLSMDDSHNRTREELRSVQSGGSSDHLMAGLKGFGYGLLGGVTSIATQTFKGTRDEGFGVRFSCSKEDKSAFYVGISKYSSLSVLC